MGLLRDIALQDVHTPIKLLMFADDCNVYIAPGSVILIDDSQTNIRYNTRTRLPQITRMFQSIFIHKLVPVHQYMC